MVEPGRSLPRRSGDVTGLTHDDEPRPNMKYNISLLVHARGLKRSPRMCDKYILYVYICLRRAKLQLTDKELIHLFGPKSTVFPELDPIWIKKFLVRCRISYDKYVSRCIGSSNPGLSTERFLYKARTHDSSSGQLVVSIANPSPQTSLTRAAR